MSSKNVCSEDSSEKCPEDLCLATTSRGLSPSSGDHDLSDTYSFCSGKCSCCSNYHYVSGYCEKPLAIVDSNSKPEKSKWNTFKHYIKRHLKLKTNNGAANTCRARRSGRHARVPFTSTQASALEAAYTRSQYLAPPALRALASALQLREDRIKIWFQNRRARERREKSGTITPPQAVVLPSTAPLQRNILTHVWSQSQPHSYDIEHTQSTNLDNNLSTSVSNNTCLIPSLIYMSEEDSNDSRPNTPLDVETITD